MNILLIVKLSDSNLNCLLQPLLLANNVEHVYILRDTRADILSNRISFITDYTFKSNKIFKHIFRAIKGIQICRKYHINIVVGVLIYPHGYIGRIISFFVKLPYIHITIAGQREFWVFGKLVESFNLFIFKKSKTITVTGNSTLSYLLSKGYNRKSVEVLPNIIDIKKYQDFKRLRNYDIISVSSLDKNKNVSLLLKALAKIRGHNKITALILGKGPELENLVFESKALAINENVHFKGWIADEEAKVDYYNSCKLFVLCSKGEGFPLALIEGMACGCVPIITNVGDIADLVTNGENGYILKSYTDENELANLLESLLSNPEKITSLSAKANEITNNYSFRSVSLIWNKILMN